VEIIYEVHCSCPKEEPGGIQDQNMKKNYEKKGGRGPVRMVC